MSAAILGRKKWRQRWTSLENDSMRFASERATVLAGNPAVQSDVEHMCGLATASDAPTWFMPLSIRLSDAEESSKPLPSVRDADPKHDSSTRADARAYLTGALLHQFAVWPNERGVLTARTDSGVIHIRILASIPEQVVQSGRRSTSKMRGTSLHFACSLDAYGGRIPPCWNRKYTTRVTTARRPGGV
jgi:hypothetical protein